jgi:L-ascorbate metabolism protein UlaG (beta-lactamase superfamily)
MDVVSLGHSSFKISNKSSVLVTDPFDPAMVGLKFPKVEKANVVTISHDHNDHNNVSVLPSDVFVINGPGEYEVGGVMVTGVSTFHDEEKGAARGKNTVYVITVDDLRICHLGDLGHKLTDDQMARIGQVDVLLVPVGGHYTINSTKACEVVAQLEPSVIIPMHYNRSGLDPKTFGELDGVEKFLKEMGVGSVTPVAKYSTSKEKLPESMAIVVVE